MNKIFKLFSVLAVSSLSLSSCIEETFPEDSIATGDQIGGSSSALEAALNGIPSQMVQGYFVYGRQVNETDMAYPQFMIAQTEMLGDMYALGGNTGYDWYAPYNPGHFNMGENSYYSFLPWFTLYKFVKSANDVIATVDMNDESVSPAIKGRVGIAYACRAFYYYLLTVFFEPVDNIYTDCSKVLGYTVPVVTDKTTPEEAKNNPRLTHDEMIKFILSDLDVAEAALTDFTPTSKLFPDLSVVYGLKAKVYLWDEDYANAALYARKAIETSGATPSTKEQWLDPSAGGFNTANQSWMWYITYSAENMGNLCNFTGWMASEADWGYGALSCPGIDRSLYDKIATTDFRKYAFIDPAKRDFYPYLSVRDDDWMANAPAYLNLKFRCKDGDYMTYSIGGVCDLPVMRVEEMYLIEAEAVGASEGVEAGKSKLNAFMQAYRQPDYNCKAIDLRTFQLEVLTQMRIEFWGEGNAFPTAKRLKPDVIQNYEGTNAPEDPFKINCKGIKPHWNLVIPIDEVESNNALKGMNNPDPTKTVVGPTPIGEFAPGK